MKVLHLVGAEEDTGGVLTVIRNLQTATVVHDVDHAVWVHERYTEMRRPHLNYRRSRYILGDSPHHLRLLSRACLGAAELRRQLREQDVDLLHAHTRGSLLVAILVTGVLRRPVVFTNHNYARRTWLYRQAAKLHWMWTTLLTPNMARHYRLSASTTGKIRLTSACCADAFFAKPLAPRRNLTPDRPVRLVGLGTLLHWKKWHVLLQASRLLSAEDRARLEFHHWGPEQSDAESQAYARGLRELCRDPQVLPNEFHGLSLSVEEPLREADWFVLPSTNEPCSVALIEALALGVPAVVSASGGNVDIIQAERTGLFFQPDDPASLAAVLQRLARNQVAPSEPALVRETVRHRCASAVADRFLELYRELAALRHQGPGTPRTAS